MNDPLILTFDVGTQSLRAMLFDQQGNTVDFVQIRYETPYFIKDDIFIEQWPDFYIENMEKASLMLKEKNPKDFERAVAVASTVFRDTVVCLDKDIKPLVNLILWLDKREADRSKLPSIPKYKEFIFRLVGMWDTIETQQRQSACNWLMSERPDIWEKTYKFVLLPTYINYALTGKLIDSTANQIGHVPFDYKKGYWMGKSGLTRCLFNIPADKLISDIVEPGEIIGNVTKEFSLKSGIKEGLPVIVTGADKACETIGLSVADRTKAAVSFGTAASISVFTEKHIEPEPYAPCYPSVYKGKFTPEIQIYRGFWMLSWFKREYAREEKERAEKLGVSVESILDKELPSIPAGSDGLVLQPYWTPGILYPNARGAIIGYTDKHTRAHLYRAIVEGIGYDLYRSLKTMEKRTGNRITDIYCGGGGSKSDEVCQIIANIFGLPLHRIQTHESCALGAALIAFESLGFYESVPDAIKNMVRIKDTFTPDMEEHKLYSKLYSEVYVKMSKALLPLNKSIKNIMKNNK